jgi:hypothetical protein
LIDKEKEQLKNLKMKYPSSSTEENERIKQLALRRRKELYGEEVESIPPKQLVEPSYKNDNQLHKEKTLKERQHRATIELENNFKKEQERIQQKRMNRISEMEKEAGQKFTFTISQVEKLNGKIALQSDKVFEKSMKMLQQSYEMIMKRKKIPLKKIKKRDEIDRLI